VSPLNAPISIFEKTEMTSNLIGDRILPMSQSRPALRLFCTVLGRQAQTRRPVYAPCCLRKHRPNYCHVSCRWSSRTVTALSPGWMGSAKSLHVSQTRTRPTHAVSDTVEPSSKEKERTATKKESFLTFQDAISRLQQYWASVGCALWLPHNTEVGAGTMNPATFLRVLGPEPWNVAYAEPSIRPDDSRYGDNPNRVQRHTQFQVSSIDYLTFFILCSPVCSPLPLFHPCFYLDLITIL